MRTDRMDVRSRLALLVAAIISVPLVALALTGAGYIAYSLLAQAWYRDLFAAYGTKLMLLYAFFAIGVAAAASVALRYPAEQQRATRFGLIVASLAGIVAATLLEAMFWADDDRFMPRGLLLLPFVAWAVVAARARRGAVAASGRR